MDELSARGIEHYNAGRFAEALRCFRAAGGPEARVFAAHVLDSAGRAEESAAEFAGAIEAFPLHLPAYEGLAKLIIRGAAPGGAAALRGILSAGASGSSGTLRLCARAFAACGDDAAAEKALRAALRRSPRDAESRALLADLLGAREKAALAELHRRALASVGAGRFAEAERTYRRALRLSPRDAEAAKGLDGVLRSRARSAASAGRLAAADALLREALARSPRDAELRGERALIAARRGDVRRALSFRPASGEVLLLCAEARLAGGREAEAEKLLRRVPAGDPAEAKARKRLAAILRARAIAHDVPNAPLRRERARRAWEEVVRADPEDGAARVSLSLLERWTGTAQGERAYLGEAVAPGRSLSRPERFMALMRLGRFAEAVGLAEAALDDGMTLADFRAFIDPWEKDNRPDRTAPQTDVAALDAALRDAPGPWRAFYLGSLGGPLEHFDAVPPGDRYRWMNYNAAMEALFRESFSRAVAWFEAALREPLVDWRAHGYFAEALLCVDRPAEARRQMKLALAAAPENERAQVFAWWGELELWLGGYARALELTARACRMGAPFAHGWKGAALLKLGRPARALKQLDHALSLFPNDAEARLWRAETNRELGRHREALKELETVLPEHRVWVLVNRALCRYALGDAAGMASDVESLPENVVAHVRARSGLEGPLDPARTARLLEAALRLGRGFRRAEYGQAVWLSRAH